MTSNARITRILAVSLIALGGFSTPIAAQEQTLSGPALVKALRQGGYIIVLRHASSPRETPTQQSANADNVKRERQLDEAGRSAAIAFGKALQELKIPIGEVYSSPTYRTLETVRFAKLTTARVVAELGDGGQSMQGATDDKTAWLLKNSTDFPSGTNRMLVTHSPNMTRAFPKWASGVAEGEALVLGKDRNGAATLVARVKIEEWQGLLP